MAEVTFKVDIPRELRSEFKIAIGRVIEEFIEETEYLVARKVLSKSKLTKKQAKKLADEVKLAVAKRHGV